MNPEILSPGELLPALPQKSWFSLFTQGRSLRMSLGPFFMSIPPTTAKMHPKSITEEVFIDPMVIHRFALLVTNAIFFLLNSKSLSLKLPELQLYVSWKSLDNERSCT